MKPSALTTAELADRWGVKQVTLRRWRMVGKGPPWFRTNGENGHVRYPLKGIIKYEKAQIGE
jgi:DNA-binding transcriptional MerR regulator